MELGKLHMLVNWTLNHSEWLLNKTGQKTIVHQLNT